MLKGYKSAYSFVIITKHSKEIEHEILYTLHHSSTRVHGNGSFSNSEKDILICVVNKHQLVDFYKILQKFDNTFSFVVNVNDTLGNFKIIK